MCTAITYKTKDHYFGRNFDLDYSYCETVTITPRNYPFKFRNADTLKSHYAMIGMAFVSDGYPLYYDAANEKGLSIAALNFPGNAEYNSHVQGKDNIATFELIPWILGQCASISEAKKLLERINIDKTDFSKQLRCHPLHWMIADRTGALTVECVKDGLKIYDNNVGVLTNNPPFDFQILNLNNYMSISKNEPKNQFSDKLDLCSYSRGMGGIGLPGDLSSSSRFVKAAFTTLNSISGNSENESISQFFHILGSVEQQRGCVHLGGGKYETTLYSSCCNTDKGIYYYKTYENSQINGVNMYHEDLDSDIPVSYPLINEQQINMHN